MAAPALALLDVGSTGIKAQVRRGGEVVWAEEREVEVSAEGARVEHDPVQIAGDVEDLLESAHSVEELAGMGLACQRSTCLLWEREGARPRTPAPSWQDRRETERVEAMAGHAEVIRQLTGLRLSPHYAAPKLVGLLDADAGLGREAAEGELIAGTLDAFLRHRLTGVPTTEPTCAGRSLLYDLERNEWSRELCRIFAIPEAALPELVPSLSTEIQADGLPFLVGLGDQQAALLGHGGLDPGIVAVHFGTGAFVLASTGEELRRSEGLLSAVLAAFPDRRVFQMEGTINSAGSAVDWARQWGDIQLDAWADRDFEPEDLPILLPAFTGLAAPWWEPEVGAAVMDLHLGSNGEDLLAATLTAIAQRVADVVEAMRETGVEVSLLRLSGRLTRLRGLVRLVAELSATAVEVLRQEEAGLTGLERVALHALGENPPAEAEVRLRLEPEWDTARRQALRELWRRFVRSVIAATTDSAVRES